MKKVLFIITCVVSVSSGVYTYDSFKANEYNGVNELLLQNIEALSQDETGKGCKLHLTSICETTHNDHYLFRNR